MVAASIAGSAAIGYIGSTAAADQSADAYNNATNVTAAQQAQNQANLSPYMSAGNNALTSLSSFLSDPNNQSFTNTDFNSYSDPSYQWQLGQGQQALQNSQASQDGVLSGAALKGMQNYTQGMASTNYQNAYNNWYNTTNSNYQKLSGIASLGENAAAGLENTNSSLSNSLANETASSGNATASGISSATNALSSGLSSYTANLQLQQLLKQNQKQTLTPPSMDT